MTNGRLMWDTVGGLRLDENVGRANESKMERERWRMKPDWKDRVMTDRAPELVAVTLVLPR